MAEKYSQDGIERLGFLQTSDSNVLDLRSMNDDIKGIGAYLTESGIHEVLASRQNTLARQGRLQWSLEMTQKILERASASPYAEQDTLPQVINEWYEVILYIQNQTEDFLADDDIIFAVAEYYDNYCGGDADLLRGKAADRIIKNYRMKKKLWRGSDDTPGRQNAFDDEEVEIQPQEQPLPVNGTFQRNVFAVRGQSETSGEKSDDIPAQRDTSLRRKTHRTDEEAHEILALFQKELMHYVGEGASSVSERTGRNIFASVRYTLSLASDPEKSVVERFCDGQKRLLSILEESEHNFRAILAMQIHLPLDTYYGTLYREIPTFFRLYDAQYAAHETPGLMDYPLNIEIENMSGIIYMHEYLRRLRIECEYIHRVPEEICSELVRAYSRKYDMDVTSVPVNFFEILMGQAFAVALILDTQGKDPALVWNAAAGAGGAENSAEAAGPAANESPAAVWLRPISDFLPALSKIAAMSYSERRERLGQICEAVCVFLHASSPETIEYAHIQADRWIVLFEGALENQCPENLILLSEHKQEEIAGKVPDYFALGEPMPDDEYSDLVERLGAAADVSEQNRLIRTFVHSRKDLLDILDEDFWMTGEKESFLATFSPEEQALFAEEEQSEPILGKN